MKIFVTSRLIIYPEYSRQDIEIFLFSRKEYQEAYMLLYGKAGDRQSEMELDEKVPEMKTIIDNLAISLNPARQR